MKALCAIVVGLSCFLLFRDGNNLSVFCQIALVIIAIAAGFAPIYFKR